MYCMTIQRWKMSRTNPEALPEAKMELLPYHKYGMIKYEALGRPFNQEDFYRPDADRMERLRGIVREQGVETADYR